MSVATITFSSQALEMSTPVTIAFPDAATPVMDFSSDDDAAAAGPAIEPRASLYLLHGLTGTHQDWTVKGNAHHLANEYNIVIIMPDGQRSFYVDMPRALRFESWIARELPQALATLTRIPSGREVSAIAGLSMGGYGAMRLALHHPERYGAAMSLSGCLDMTEPAFMSRHPDLYHDIFQAPEVAGTEHDLLSEVATLAERCQRRGITPPRLWAACGQGDRLLGHQRAFARAADQAGVDLHRYEAPGVHDWHFWNTHLPAALDWWLAIERAPAASDPQ